MKYNSTFRLEVKSGQSLGKIYSEITFNGKRIRTHLGYSVVPKDWVKAKGEVKPAANVRVGNRVLRGSDINSIIKQVDANVAELFGGKYFPDAEYVKTTIVECIGGVAQPKRNEVFFDMFELHNNKRDISNGRLIHYRYTLKLLRDFFANKKYLSFDNFTLSNLEDFYEWMLNKKIMSINYANNIISRVLAFWRWSMWEYQKNGDTIPFPFHGFKPKPTLYGDPIYLKRAELEILIDASLSGKLDRVRDIFVFQCMCGCRVGDLLSLQSSNVSGGELSYIQGKTRNTTAETVTVPLTKEAQRIIKKYENSEDKRLLPFITDVNYNKYLKELFKLLELNRPITILNSKTRASEIKPLCDIISSHAGRRTFVGLLYEANVKDSIISSMSGHAEGSKAFLRYRKVTRDLKNDAINIFDLNKNPGKES
ncbi:MAG: phage integrase SAM-like domain-containing protein [Bacteroidales bacterium]